MPRSNKPNKSKDSKKSSTHQPRNRNRSSTTNNNGSAVQRGGGNPTNGSRRTSDSNSSALGARAGGGGDPRRPGFVRGRFDSGAWLEEAGATDSSAANGDGGGSNSNRRTLTAPGGSSGGGCLQESLAIPDFSSSLSRLNFGNLSADEQRSLAEYFYAGVHSAQRPYNGNDRRSDVHIDFTTLIAQKGQETQAMARRGLQEVRRLTRDFGSNGAAASAAFNSNDGAQSNVPAVNQANQQGSDSEEARSRRPFTCGAGHDVGYGGGSGTRFEGIGAGGGNGSDTGGSGNGGGDNGSGGRPRFSGPTQDFSSFLSRLKHGNMSADEQRALAEYLSTVLQPTEPSSRRRRRFDRQMDLKRLIAEETLESKAMARRGLRAVNRLTRDVEGPRPDLAKVERLTRDVEGLGNTSAQHERRLNAVEDILEELLAQANQQCNATDSEGENSEEDSEEDSDASDA